MALLAGIFYHYNYKYYIMFLEFEDFALSKSKRRFLNQSNVLGFIIKSFFRLGKILNLKQI